MADSRTYAVNRDWVWGPDNPELTKSATLRVELVNESDAAALDDLVGGWLASHQGGGRGVYWDGAVAVRSATPGTGRHVVLLTSSGQDVAESLDATVAAMQRAVIDPLESTAVTWLEQPLTD